MTDARNIGPDSDPCPSESNADPQATVDVAAITSLPTPDLGAIGAYRLLRKLGEGGMGYVWLAEQTTPVTRQVALKIIKAGRYDASALKRFELERQSLAIMNHPAIAKVFDAASTDEGQPYFVMEYVPGLPITTYCDQKRLTTRQRLELFIRVCEGVQHAHQKAIMHRDLKPSNILVADVDGHSLPRIIDFGIAKATTPQSPDQTAFTQLGGMIGTPGYISPEQADPAVIDVDIRTDVYSLGVILYELLTSALPFDAKQWHTQPFHEVLRHLREDDPPLPSTKVSTDQKTSTSAAAANRNTEPHQLASQLRGDLDWISLKALEKDRSRRYDSCSALAADIQRYLENRPVLATPPSFGYRAKKFVRRNRSAVLAASAVVLMLVALAITMTVQAIRIAKERDRANREAAAAKTVSDFLTGLFKVSDPSEARGNVVTARQILDKGVQQIDTSLAAQPEVQARLMGTMGEVYWSLGLYREAEPLLEKAVATRTTLLGPEHPDTLQSLYLTAKNLNDDGQYAEAEKRLHTVLDIQRRVLGPDNADTVKSMIAIAGVIYGEGRYQEAEKMQRDVLALQRRMPVPDERRIAMTMNNLATNLEAQGRNAESEQLFAETVDLERRVFGPEHPVTLQSMSNMGRTLNNQRKYAESERLMRQTIDIQRRVLGPDHGDTQWSIHNLAVALRESGKRQDAEQLFRETLSVREKTLGPEHPDTLGSMEELAVTLDELHRYPEAAELYRKAIESQSRVFGSDHPVTASTKYNLACNAALRGDRAEAIGVLRDALAHGLPLITAAGMAEDDDLKSLRADPRFTALLAEVKTREAGAKSQ
jgi:eukaryotic-like serine/threonine-protein kinase